MNRYQEELCTNLCTLLADDYTLLNDIIIDYVNNINDNEFDNLERHVNNNLSELM